MSARTGMLPLELRAARASHSFDLPPISEGVPWLDKYMLMAIVVASC